MRAYGLGQGYVLPALGILAISLAARAVPPGKAVQEVRALEASGDASAETSLSAAVSDAIRAFDAPVNCEIHPSYGRSTARTVDELPFAVKHSVKKNETLRHCLDELVELSRGLLEVQTILGNVCIVPRKQSPEEILTNLDVRVSLHVEGASTWDALKALVTEINSAKATEYGLFVTLRDLKEGKSPPKAFTEEKTISLLLEDVTARHALCAIMNASPLELSYTHVCGTETDTLVISIHEDGKPVVASEPFTSEEMEWWVRERDEVGWKRTP